MEWVTFDCPHCLPNIFKLAQEVIENIVTWLLLTFLINCILVKHTFLWLAFTSVEVACFSLAALHFLAATSAFEQWGKLSSVGMETLSTFAFTLCNNAKTLNTYQQPPHLCQNQPFLHHRPPSHQSVPIAIKIAKAATWPFFRP